MKNLLKKYYLKVVFFLGAIVLLSLAYAFYFSGNVQNQNSKQENLSKLVYQSEAETEDLNPEPAIENLTQEVVNEESSDQGEIDDEMENQTDEVGDQEDMITEEENLAMGKNEPIPDLKIGMLADAHVGKEFGYESITSFVDISKKEKFDVIVNLGDLTESRYSYNNLPKDEAKEEYRKAKAFLPNSYDVLGNHELLSMTKKDVEKINGHDNYYAFKINDYQIIVLDANYTENEESIEAGGKSPKIYKGTIPQKEFDWLEERLGKSKKNIIFSHNPIYNLNESNREKVKDLIEKNKKRILFIANGHRHPSSLRHSKFGGVDNYEIPSGKFQKSYAIAKLYGRDLFINGIKFKNQ